MFVYIRAFLSGKECSNFRKYPLKHALRLFVRNGLLAQILFLLGRRMCPKFAECVKCVQGSMYPSFFRQISVAGMSVWVCFQNSSRWNSFAYICTFPTVLRCPSCLRHHGCDIMGSNGCPSPSSSLRCPNSCHGRPRAHKLAPSNWGMTSMTSMTFERWDVCLKQPGSQKGGNLFLMHIFYRSLSTSAFAILDLVKACHGCWVYQLHPSSEMCVWNTYSIQWHLQKGTNIMKIIAIALQTSMFLQGSMSPWFHPLTHLSVSASQCWKMFSRWDSK